MIPDWINEQVAWWKVKLTLQEWEISIGLSANIENYNGIEANAEVTTYNDVRKAVINLANTVPAEYERDWEQTIVHELLHVKLSPYVDYVDGVAASLLPPQIVILIQNTFLHLVEPIVESLSLTLVNLRYEEPCK